MSASKGNPFAALAQGDSDSEDSIPVQQQETAPPTPSFTNTQKVPPASPPFRVWNLQGEERPQAVFRAAQPSPFSSKKKRGKVIHGTADHEGWVSIKKNQPQLIDDSANSSDTEQEIKREALMEALGELTALDSAPAATAAAAAATTTQQETASTGMRSLLSRGQNEMTALDWAERVRASLERAEQTRRPAVGGGGAPSQTDSFVSSLGRLSFFRRPAPATEGNNS